MLEGRDAELHSNGPLPVSETAIGVAGKRVIVTGAAGGIGRAITLGMIDAGAKVVAADLPGVRLDAVVSEGDAREGWVRGLEFDLSDLGSLSGMLESAVQQLGGLDVLCNVAGVQLRKPARQVTAAEWQLVMDVNLRGSFFACTQASRYLTHGGSIINFSSAASQVAIENISVYSATKSGVTQMTRALAIEWAKEGIRVNAIGPGYIRTGMTADVLADPSRCDWILHRIPAGRVGEPGDLVGATIFLASDAARYITGQTLMVDGGWVAW
ncbi:SDR family oxidoreductase [bacterium]|nr:MAG: SDR family oxidoreductase [bacterium]